MTDTLANNPVATEPADGTVSTARMGRSGCRYWVLIPCAGSGSRAGGVVPKQYRPIEGRAMVLHTLAAFAGVARIDHTLVLLAPGDSEFALLESADDAGCTSLACGADTRAGTVANGLATLRKLGAQENDWVLVHDAARCLVTPELINRLIDACSNDAVGGLLALPVSDTIKLASSSRVAATVDRTVHWLAQTPQMFRLGNLQRGLERAGDRVTDESSAIETLGLMPLLVMGESFNFKVTYAHDFLTAQAILHARQQPHQEETVHEPS